jgi:hypothetical protein
MHVIHSIVPNPLQSLGTNAKDTLLLIILLMHFTPLWFGLFWCMKTFRRIYFSSRIVHCQPICFLHIVHFNCKVFFFVQIQKEMYSTRTPSLTFHKFIGPLFFFVGESSGNKATRDGCDVCTTNVVEEASFSFPNNPSKLGSWIKCF